MNTWYKIAASTIETVPTGTLHRIAHPFYLASRDLGIKDEADAEAIARRILNTAGSASLKVVATATKYEGASPQEMTHAD